MRQFVRFLVDSPLLPPQDPDGDGGAAAAAGSASYGSWHMQ